MNLSVPTEDPRHLLDTFHKRYPNGITASAVATETDMDSEDIAGKYLRRLLKNGAISKKSRGLYTSLSETSEVS